MQGHNLQVAEDEHASVRCIVRRLGGSASRHVRAAISCTALWFALFSLAPKPACAQASVGDVLEFLNRIGGYRVVAGEQGNVLAVYDTSITSSLTGVSVIITTTNTQHKVNGTTGAPVYDSTETLTRTFDYRDIAPDTTVATTQGPQGKVVYAVTLHTKGDSTLIRSTIDTRAPGVVPSPLNGDGNTFKLDFSSSDAASRFRLLVGQEFLATFALRQAPIPARSVPGTPHNRH